LSFAIASPARLSLLGWRAGLSESDPPASRCEALRAGGGQAPGAVHHGIGPDESGFSLCSNRSIDGGKIFINRKDREDFLERLAGFA